MRPKYDDVIAENSKLKAKVKDLERAIAMADRAIKRYHCQEWIATPLATEQHDAVVEQLSNRRHGIVPAREGRRLSEGDGIERWEDMLEDDIGILPNIRHYLIHYSYTPEEGISQIKLWALIPY